MSIRDLGQAQYLTRARAERTIRATKKQREKMMINENVTIRAATETLFAAVAIDRNEKLTRENTAIMLLVNTIRHVLDVGLSVPQILDALSSLESAMYDGDSIDNS